ncbi:MAG TPA: neutral zinc metallopeptidase, partial [Sphingomicrobium sp.]|nr:neutral zinc metallopeptidase [Sphingomicrobium sp.]
MVRLGGEGPSSHFEDRTGQSFGGGGGLGGGAFPLLLGLVGSRFGIVGVLVLLLAYCAVNSLGGSLGRGGGESGQSAASKLDANTQDFLVRALGSTEEVWGEIFQRNGATYRPTNMVAYSGGTQTACGIGQAAMGPFYCPGDQS